MRTDKHIDQPLCKSKNIRMDQTMFEAVEAAAKANGIKSAQLIREGISMRLCSDLYRLWRKRQ